MKIRWLNLLAVCVLPVHRLGLILLLFPILVLERITCEQCYFVTCSFGQGPTAVESPILKTIESTSLPAEAIGPLISLSVQEGSLVSKGSEIGRVRDTAVRIQTEKAKSNIELAKRKQSNTIELRIADKNIAMARVDFQRATDANAKVEGVYPTSEVDRLKFLLERSVLEQERAAYIQKLAEFEVAVAESEFKQAFELWQRHRIVAPCDGVVVAVEKRVGEWVEPGTTLLKIVQTKILRIEGYVSEKQARNLKLGTIAEVTLEENSLDEPFDSSKATNASNTTNQTADKKKAKLTFISPEANAVNTQVQVFLELDNRDLALRPGLRPKQVQFPVEE